MQALNCSFISQLIGWRLLPRQQIVFCLFSDVSIHGSSVEILLDATKSDSHCDYVVLSIVIFRFKKPKNLISMTVSSPVFCWSPFRFFVFQSP